MDLQQSLIKPEPEDDNNYSPLFVSDDEDAGMEDAATESNQTGLGDQYEEDLLDIKVEFGDKTRLSTPAGRLSRAGSVASNKSRTRRPSIFIPKRKQPPRTGKAHRKITKSRQSSIDLDDPAIQNLIATASGPGVWKPDNMPINPMPSQQPKSAWLEREQKKLQIDGSYLLKNNKLKWKAPPTWVYVDEADDSDAALMEGKRKLADGTLVEDTDEGECVVCKLLTLSTTIECIKCEEHFHLECVEQPVRGEEYPTCDERKCNQILPHDYYQCKVCEGFRYCRPCFGDHQNIHNPKHKFRHVDEGFTCPRCLVIESDERELAEEKPASSIVAGIRKEQTIRRRKSLNLMRELDVDAEQIALTARARKKRKFGSKFGPGADQKNDEGNANDDLVAQANIGAEKSPEKRRKKGKNGVVASVNKTNGHKLSANDEDLTSQFPHVKNVNRPTKTNRSRRSPNVRQDPGVKLRLRASTAPTVETP